MQHQINRMTNPDSIFSPLDSWGMNTRRVMRLFFVYRVVLAGALGFFILTHTGPAFLGSSMPYLHNVVVLIYFALAVASLGFSFFNLLSIEVEYLFAMLVDSLIIALLIHTSGGPQSGLGILLGISIAFGTQGMPARATMLAALMATLAILAETYFSAVTHFRSQSTYTMAAMLGVSYFALALLSYELSHRTRFSEKVMQKQDRDIHDLMRMNEQVIQYMQTGVLILDQDNHIKMANESAWRLLGCPSDFTGHELEIINSALSKQLRRWRQRPHQHSQWMENPAGKQDLLVRFVKLNEAENSPVLLFLDDASEATETAQQLKLASLGRLVASIAHEIRNPLGAISHANQLLQESDDLQAADKHMTEIIGRNTARVNEVIENILTLSRHQATRPKQIQLQVWLQQIAADLMENHKLSKDQIDVEVSPEDTQLVFDPQQIAQAVNALADNAVVHHNGDQPLKLTIRAGMEPTSKEGFIEIIDNGEKIKDDLIEKIFEPFFTTAHSGTGLGLYVVKALCDANGIRVSYQASRKGGNCFRLLFPANASPVILLD